jgi:hypothetical protein
MPEEGVSVQLDLLTQPAARRTDPATSHVAAAQVRFAAGSHRALILAALERASRRGATHRELAELTGLHPVQVDRRLIELRRLERAVRLTEIRGEPPAHVHVLPEWIEGRAVLGDA